MGSCPPQTRPDLSVCIPAFNEEASIRRAIQSVLRQDFLESGTVEILVGPNGCTDKTVEVALGTKIPTESATLHVVQIEGRGKPKAWNQLIESAKAELVCFIDADVQLDAHALSSLVHFLDRNREIILAAGTHVALMNHCSFLTRLTVPKITNGLFLKENQGFICGRLYAFHKSSLLNAMKVTGFDKMPEHLIGDDVWLQQMLDLAASRMSGAPLVEVLAGRGRIWAVCREAFAYFVPQEYWEIPALRARALHSRDQMRKVFPSHTQALEEMRTLKQSQKGSAQSRLMGFVQRWGLRHIARAVLSTVLNRYFRSKANRMYLRDLRSGESTTAEKWIRSESSRDARRI